MLTRIRNAGAIGSATVDVPASKFKRALAEILMREGYLASVEDATDTPHPTLRLGLKYGPRRQPVINHIGRISKPGRRAYSKASSVPVVRGGLGVSIVSTSQGLMVDREARRKNVGGEVVCEVW